MPRPNSALILAFACLFAAGCAEEVQEYKTPEISGQQNINGTPSAGSCGGKSAAMSAAIINGTRSPQYVSLSAEQTRAIVGLGDIGYPGAWCSGTLISEDIVLTAEHCTRGMLAEDLKVIFGPDDFAPEHEMAVAELIEHASADIAMLRLAAVPKDYMAVSPLYISLDPISNLSEGIILEQSGFGITESGSSDGRLFVVETYSGVADDQSFYKVNGNGEAGVCFGDSGGPSMISNSAGETRVLGALSMGEEDCVSLDYYTRVDLVVPWVENWTGPTPTVAPIEPAGCGEITYQGECDTNTLRYCSAGSVQAVGCGGCGQECGFVNATVGYACIDVAE